MNYRAYSESYLNNKYYYSKYTNYIIRCNECNTNKIKGYCNICKKSTCCRKKCCELFPHYNNTLFVICKHCINKIEEKLYILEDNSSIILCKRELRTLKEKIKNKLCKTNNIL